MEWILTAAYTFLFIVLLLRLKVFELPGIPPVWLAGTFLLKVLAGISLGLIYTYHYTDRSTADTFKFFDDSRVMFNALRENPYDFLRMVTGIDADAPELRKYYLQMDAWLNTDVLFNDNKTIIRLNALFHFISLGKYYVHVVLLNVLSFTGLILLYKTFTVSFTGSKKLLFAGTFLLPSVLFWGSGLLKDGLLLFAFGILVMNFSKILNNKTGFQVYAGIVLGLFLMILIKLYVLIAILPGLVAWAWSARQHGWKVPVKFAVCYALYFLMIFNIHHILPQYNFTDLIYWKQKNFNTLAELTQAKSVINIPQLDYGLKSIIINSPIAFLNTYTRPLPMDIHGNLFILMACLESLLIIGFTIIVFIFRRRKSGSSQPLILVSICFVILIFTLSGLITPILGALVRYKVPALPFLMFILVSSFDASRLLKSWRRDKVG